MKDIPIYGIYLRRCDECGRGMNSGYLDGDNYYCQRDNNACLLKHHTMKEWIDRTADGESDDCYFTEWDCLDNENEIYLEDGTPILIEGQYGK